MKRHVGILVVITALFAGGCAGMVQNVNTQMDSWVGKNVSELVTSWGPPYAAQDIGGGMRVLTWAVYTIGDVIGGSRRPSGYRMFTVDANGYVTSWHWQGLDPEPEAALGMSGYGLGTRGMSVWGESATVSLVPGEYWQGLDSEPEFTSTETVTTSVWSFIGRSKN